MTNTVRVVNHGKDADRERPDVETVVWVGADFPNNAIYGDKWSQFSLENGPLPMREVGHELLSSSDADE